MRLATFLSLFILSACGGSAALDPSETNPPTREDALACMSAAIETANCHDTDPHPCRRQVTVEVAECWSGIEPQASYYAEQVACYDGPAGLIDACLRALGPPPALP